MPQVRPQPVLHLSRWQTPSNAALTVSSNKTCRFSRSLRLPLWYKLRWNSQACGIIKDCLNLTVEFTGSALLSLVTPASKHLVLVHEMETSFLNPVRQQHSAITRSPVHLVCSTAGSLHRSAEAAQPVLAHQKIKAFDPVPHSLPDHQFGGSKKHHQSHPRAPSTMQSCNPISATYQQHQTMHLLQESMALRMAFQRNCGWA